MWDSPHTYGQHYLLSSLGFTPPPYKIALIGIVYLLKIHSETRSGHSWFLTYYLEISMDVCCMEGNAVKWLDLPILYMKGLTIRSQTKSRMDRTHSTELLMLVYRWAIKYTERIVGSFDPRFAQIDSTHGKLGLRAGFQGSFFRRFYS